MTNGTHVTAGQLALALTPYAQVSDLAVNTAASGNNAAAIQSLHDRVTAELASKLDSSALAPAIAPLATAAALATTDGQVAAHGSSIAALQSSQGRDLKLSNYSTTAAMNGSIGLLHLLTSGHSVGRLPHGNGAGRGDDQRHHGRAAGLLHLLTSGRAVGRQPHGERAGHADAGAIAGALLAYRTGPDQVFTTNQITSRWWRAAQPPTRTRRRPRAFPNGLYST